MLVRTSLLSDLALDYAVATVEGLNPRLIDYGVHGRGVFVPKGGDTASGQSSMVPYSPTLDLALSMRLLEGYAISITVRDEMPAGKRCSAAMNKYTQDNTRINRISVTGERHTVAIARAVVTAKAGEAFDLPDYLLTQENYDPDFHTHYSTK